MMLGRIQLVKPMPMDLRDKVNMKFSGKTLLVQFTAIERHLEP